MAGEYRTIFGVVQFDTQEAEAAGKDILRFTIRSNGTKDQSQLVSCTLWPSHADYFKKLAKGTAVVVQGKYSVNKGTDKDGDPKTYHNLSVSDLLVLGEVDSGEEVETTRSAASSDDGDEDSW